MARERRHTDKDRQHGQQEASKPAREQLRSSDDHVTRDTGQTVVGYTRERLFGAQMPGRACVDGAAAGVGPAGVQINLVQRRERSGSLNPPRLILSSPTFRTS